MRYNPTALPVLGCYDGKTDESNNRNLVVIEGERKPSTCKLPNTPGGIDKSRCTNGEGSE